MRRAKATVGAASPPKPVDRFESALPDLERRPERYASLPSRPLTARELIAMARSARKVDPIG